jgi:hypothetical protein
MTSAAEPMLTILNLNTRLFVNCLKDVDNALAIARPNTNTNNMAFLACHLVDARHYQACLLGIDVDCSLMDDMAEVKSIEDMRSYPPLADLVAAWTDVSHLLEERLAAATAAELAQPIAEKFPVDNPTLGSAILFLLQHESFHLGQLALLRKYFELPAMGYAEGNAADHAEVD